MSKTYETIIIVDALLDDENVDSIIQKYSTFLTKNNCTITNVDRWGRKKFAYQIKKKHTGFYISIEFTGPADAVAKLERQYHLDENILRYLTVSFDKRTLAEKRAYFEKKAQLEAEFREREAAEALKRAMAEEAPMLEENPESTSPDDDSGQSNEV